MQVLDSRLLGLTALVTVAYQLSFFIVTYLCRFDTLTDFAGSTNFVVLALLTLTLSGFYTARQIVMTACVCLWGLRLGAFLLYRILLWGEDRRFDDKRNDVAQLAIFWTIQAVWVWTVSLPITITNSSRAAPPLGALDYIGWAVFACGLVLEAVADQQKLVYKRTPESKGRWTDVGVWKWSRHPNYFGEMVVWWGLYIASTAVLRGAEHLAVLGPIFITLILLFVSGIPLLEQGADKKHGKKKDYLAYKKRTSVLFPVPPALYEKLSEGVKKSVFLDIPLYNKMDETNVSDVEAGLPEKTEASPITNPGES